MNKFLLPMLLPWVVMVSWVDAQTWGPWSWSRDPMVCTTGVDIAQNQLSNNGSGTFDSVKILGRDGMVSTMGISLHSVSGYMWGNPTLDTAYTCSLLVYDGGGVVDTATLAISCVNVNPVISGVSGTFTEGQTVTISGSLFGNKGTAKPYIWCPFTDSFMPSNLGIVTAWNDTNTGNMRLNSGRAVSVGDGGAYTIAKQADGFAWNDYGRKMFIYRKTLWSYDLQGTNWKMLRIWGVGIEGYPDFYVGRDAFIVENINYGTGQTTPSIYFRGNGSDSIMYPVNQWKTEEILVRSNTDSLSRNGYFLINSNGRYIEDCPSYSYLQRYLITHGISDGNKCDYAFFGHGVLTGTSWQTGETYQLDDIYVDSSFCRVMIGNKGTWEASKKRDIQIPSSYSQTSATVTFHCPDFSADDSAYIYIFNNGNMCNVAGYPLKIGGTQSDTVYQARGWVRR